MTPSDLHALDNHIQSKPGRGPCCDHKHPDLEECPAEVARWYADQASESEGDEDQAYDTVMTAMTQGKATAARIVEAYQDSHSYAMFCVPCGWVGTRLEAYMKHGTAERCPKCHECKTVGLWL